MINWEYVEALVLGTDFRPVAPMRESEDLAYMREQLFAELRGWA